MSHAISQIGYLYVGFAVLIGVFELWRPREQKFDFLFFFNVTFGVYFALAPMHVFFGGEAFVSLTWVWEGVFERATWVTHVHHFLIIFTTYCGVVAAYLLPRAQRNTGRLNFYGVSTGSVGALAIVFFVIGLASVFLYTRELGGLIAGITTSALVRSGVVEFTGQYAFLRKFMPFVIGGSILLLLYTMRHPRGTARSVLSACFAFSLLLVIGVSLMEGSRRALLIALATFFFFAANYNDRWYAKSLLIFGSIAGAMLMFGDLFSLSWYYGFDGLFHRVGEFVSNQGANLYPIFWRSLTLPFMETAGVIEYFDGVPRFFLDIPLAFAYFVPERILPLELPREVAALSTELLTNMTLDEIDEVPPSFIGFLWYSGYWPGILIGSFAYGWLGRYLATAFQIRERRDPVYPMLYVLLAFSWGYFLRFGSFYMLLSGMLHWFALIASVVLLSRVRRVSRVGVLTAPR